MNTKLYRFNALLQSRWKKKVHNIIFTRHMKIVTNEKVNSVSYLEIKAKLKQSGIASTDGYSCLLVNECTLCHPLVKRTTSARSTDIYINKTTGSFTCENCKCTGNWDVLHRLLSECKKNPGRTGKEVAALKDGCERYDKSSTRWQEVVAKSQPLHHLPETDLSALLADFQLASCPVEVVEKLGVYVNEERSCLYFPLHVQSQHVVGYVTYDKSGSTTTVPRSDTPGFVVFPHKKKQSTAVLVSNIPDLFVLAAQEIHAHVICLPYGVANLPQDCLPHLESYSKIVLWLGSKVGAWDSAKNFAKKLNDKRCFVIRPTGNQYSPSAAVANEENVHKLIAEAQPTWHQAITTFSSLRNDVLTELQNNEQVLGIKWKRYPALNRILKGHRRGELSILTGPTGSGKTTFMSDYSLDLAMQGVNTLWGSFEIRNVRLVRTMLQQYAGLPLEENIAEFNTWADKFEKLPLYYMTFHGQQSIKTVMEAVEYSSYIYDIAHVIIDNVQFMIGVADDSKYVDRFWKQDVIIQAFRNFATKNNCHVTLVIHPRKEREAEDLTANSIFGGAKAAQEADNILIIQDKRLTTVRGKKYLQVCKNRYTGDLGVMVLDFDKSSLSYMPKKKSTEIKGEGGSRVGLDLHPHEEITL